jgi:hypothetical protein
MRCPACWAEKAFVRQAKNRKDVFLRYLSFVPMRCHHCYHEFYVPWILTLGQKTAPAQRSDRDAGVPSVGPMIVRHAGSTRAEQSPVQVSRRRAA